MAIVNLCKWLRRCLALDNASAWIGLFASVAIATAWLISLFWSLSWHLTSNSPIVLALWLLFRTFLHTGLFVIAHDAMHGNIVPAHPGINRWVGQLSLRLYGFLPYRTCRKLHWQHHKHPAQDQDPDFCPKSDDNLIWYFVRWYCSFMGSYLTPQNLTLLMASVGVTVLSLVFIFKITLQNLVLFWVAPWVLSSMQLFAFGIFLPHQSDDRNNVPHQPRSYYYPLLWSLLACYHFGYHREHHAYPDIPWYQLPYVRLMGT